MIGIFACGDIVIKSDGGEIASDELEKIISSSDIAICNLENIAGNNVSSINTISNIP